MSGDVSLAADVTFPDPKGYGDRKAVLVIRQNLDDDSNEAMTGEHGTGMIHLAWRPAPGRHDGYAVSLWRNSRRSVWRSALGSKSAATRSQFSSV